MARPPNHLPSTACLLALLVRLLAAAAAGASPSAEDARDETCLLQLQSGQLMQATAAAAAAADSEAASDDSAAQEAAILQTWLGMDSPRGAGRPAPPRATEPKRSQFQVLGLYNTGTNLLHELLSENFGLGGAATSSGQLVNGRCFFWKHNSLSVLRSKLPKILQDCGASDTMGVAMVRNPLAWLHSMHRVAYDLTPCVHGTDWLTRRCRYPARVDGGNLLAGMEFPNLEQVWADWTLDYENITSFGFQRGLLVRYEDLVLDTDGVLDRIGALTNLTRSAEVRQVAKGVSPCQHELDARAHAIRQIRSRSYLMDGVFSKKLLRQACARLDRDAMRRHGYTDCDDLGL